MNKLKLLAVILGAVLLQACKHPLAIVGEGDIIDVNNSDYGCTLEQSQAGDAACTDNEVTGDYHVNFRAEPRLGWRFVQWEGPCAQTSEYRHCRIDVTADWVSWWEEVASGFEIPASTAVFEEVGPLPAYNFSEVDNRLQTFIDNNEVLEGISLILVDRDYETIHETALGDHPANIITLLSSISKLATVSLLWAIDEDDSIDFDLDAAISRYLPWEGVYGDRTTAQLLSNTSGIPGIVSRASGVYGVHECQYDPDFDFEECIKLIYSTELPGTQDAGTVFDYGGSQWQLTAAVGVQVTNSDWNQAFDRYIAEPCGLEVYKYGNMSLQDKYEFTGDPDSLAGTDNPQPGGGAMSSMQDMTKLLLMQLRGGLCGDKRVLSTEAVISMQANRIEGLINQFFPGRAYGMGWWGREALPNVIYDTSTYGGMAWIDNQRMIGGFITVDDYSSVATTDTWSLVFEEIIPLVQQLVDDARLAASQ
jgi:CubicO group peptidase (beta-lactamase class C family)